MIKPINDFAGRLNTEISLDENMVVKKQDRYFLLNTTLKRLITKDFYHAGTYLGKTKNGRFFPSFSLLTLMARTNANKIVVDKKTEWLFICGRDVFREGIVRMIGAKKRGDYALILNEYDECLGFGRLSHNLDEDKTDVLVRNISDIGDFLRRER